MSFLSAHGSIIRQIRPSLWVLVVGIIFGLVTMIRSGEKQKLPSSERFVEARNRVRPLVEKMLSEKSLKSGQPIFIRAFKESDEFELWMRPGKSKEWKLFKTYTIKNWGGGKLGPKLKQGDGQAPEGFYSIRPASMNPWSSFHLSMNIGYPNAYDRALGRTGDFIMIHGASVSIGCLAMTNEKIEEIYFLCDAALAAGQGEIAVHVFPFRMTEARMKEAANDPHFAFWKNLQSGYDAFESSKVVPKVKVSKAGYTFQAGG